MQSTLDRTLLHTDLEILSLTRSRDKLDKLFRNKAKKLAVVEARLQVRTACL
jgi:hypothetical protein